VVYHLEIGLLFLTLVLVGPLVRVSVLKPETEPRQNPIGLAEFPT
jgi:BCD family chlorophyll transporter-like MFS transporter